MAGYYACGAFILDNHIVRKINQNKSSDTLSFTKIIYGLTEVLKKLHTHCGRNIHAYHKNTNIQTKTSKESRL